MAAAGAWRSADDIMETYSQSASEVNMTHIKDRREPNIVVLLIDDMGWKDAGFMGSAYYETPNMDRLAESGMIFNNAYANANCAPSRASLMTGLYPVRHGIYTVGSSERGPAHLRKLIPTPNQTVLAADYQTIAEMLKAAGYACGHVGKWHLGEGSVTGPEGRGFDRNVGGIHKGQPPAGYFSPYAISTLPDGPEHEYLTDRLTDEAIAFIEDYHDQPFFLYFAHYAVHKPLQAKPEMIRKYEQKPGVDGQNNPVYAAMLESTDQSVGRIVGKLEQLGLRENTMILFVSDNGGLAGYSADGIDAHEVTSQAPLRGGKGMLYEGGIRVPMVVSWPNVVKSGTAVDHLVSVMDFFPTIREAAGIPEAEQSAVDGESLIPLWTGEGELHRDSLFWHLPAYLDGRNNTWRSKPGAAMRHKQWKLIECFEDNRFELYNLESDIGERHNLAIEQPEKMKEMVERMLNWRSSIGATVPSELNPAYGKESG